MRENILLYDILRKDANLVEKSLRLKSTNMKQRMICHDTYLHIAIDGSEITPIQKMLINHPDIDINASNANSETVLIKAAKCKNIELFDLIVSHPNFDPKLSFLDEAFYYAVSSKELSRKFLQMKSLNVNSHIDRISTPLMGAIISNDEELVQMIVHHPTFDPIKSKIISCLYQAVSCKNLNLFKFFLKMNGDDINIKNENNISLLCHATSIKDNVIILNEILNNEKFDSIKSDIETAFLHSKDLNSMKLLTSYDEKHENLLTLEKIDLKMQLNTHNEDNNKAHQYLLRKKGIVPTIHPFCTKVVSKNVYQKLYVCITCQMSDICEICAKICHKGHEIKEIYYGSEQNRYYEKSDSSKYNHKCRCSTFYKCKCRSTLVSEDDENIYEDLFTNKKKYDYHDDFDPDENDDNNKNTNVNTSKIKEKHNFDDLKCTLDMSGFNPILQPLYHCRKCQVDICQNCAIRCHQGHSLNYKGMMPNSICYCMDITNCKCTERKETLCTCLFYGSKKINQPCFFCNTCGTSQERVCCASCVKHCHRGHDIESNGYYDSFCYCGAKNMAVTCNANKYPPFSHLTCCTNRKHEFTPMNQRLYHCFTCGITSKDQGICESCAIHCHIGHKVVFIGIKSFVCECAIVYFYKRNLYERDLYERNLNCVASLCPEMKNTGKCSRLSCDNKDVIFGEYICYTCDKEGKKKICESCAVKCHKNHDVHFVQYSNFKCDCESCQCMESGPIP